MMRITEKQLEAVVKRINSMTDSPAEPYVKDSLGKFRAQIGCYHLSYAYGGVSLHRMHNEGGCIEDVLGLGHMPKRELYHAMHAFIRGLEAGAT